MLTVILLNVTFNCKYFIVEKQHDEHAITCVVLF